MPFARYVAEEIATDYADGLMSRREALRRLGLLGLGAAAASALLAACAGGDEGGAPATGTSTPTTAAPTSTSAPGDDLITLAGPGDLKASFAAATTPKGAVLIIHENRGLTPHFVALPKRLAGDGYTALAVDLLSKEGGTASFADSAQASAALTAAPQERLVADLRAGVDELGRREAGAKIGVMGFCFGGGMTWSLLAAGEDRLSAAVPFYGPLPDQADFSGAKAAVLAIYAELDARVNATREEAEAALKAAGLTHEVRTFPGVDHAFFNDTGPRYNATAAAEAYQAVLGWFGRHLA
jgi:carboxymethylenebutenolidase